MLVIAVAVTGFAQDRCNSRFPFLDGRNPRIDRLVTVGVPAFGGILLTLITTVKLIQASLFRNAELCPRSPLPRHSAGHQSRSVLGRPPVCSGSWSAFGAKPSSVSSQVIVDFAAIQRCSDPGCSERSRDAPNCRQMHDSQGPDAEKPTPPGTASNRNDGGSDRDEKQAGSARAVETSSSLISDLQVHPRSVTPQGTSAKPRANSSSPAFNLVQKTAFEPSQDGLSMTPVPSRSFLSLH